MEVAVISLGVIVIAQLIERYFYAKDMNQKLADSIKAIMSRNVGEFMAATKPEKMTPAAPAEAEDVELSTLSDTDFDKAIKIINK